MTVHERLSLCCIRLHSRPRVVVFRAVLFFFSTNSTVAPFAQLAVTDWRARKSGASASSLQARIGVGSPKPGVRGASRRRFFPRAPRLGFGWRPQSWSLRAIRPPCRRVVAPAGRRTRPLRRVVLVRWCDARKNAPAPTTRAFCSVRGALVMIRSRSVSASAAGGLLHHVDCLRCRRHE